MASGDTLAFFSPLSNEPPSANFMTLDLRNGHPVLDADDTTAESAVFTGVMPRNYGSSGVTANLLVAATSATSGSTVYQTAFERMVNGGDVTADSFASANSGTVPVPGTAGIGTVISIPHTHGAQIDSIVAGDFFRVKVTRNPADAQDNMTGDGELLGIELKET